MSNQDPKVSSRNKYHRKPLHADRRGFNAVADARFTQWDAQVWMEFAREVGLRFAALVTAGFLVLLCISLGAWIMPFQSPFVGCEHGCQMTFMQTVRAVWWMLWTPMLMSCLLMAVIQAFVYLRFPEGQAFQRDDVVI